MGKSTKGTMVIKMDLEKAYDRVRWTFLRETLLLERFPSDLMRLIMYCVTSVNMSVIWNGEVSESFAPTRGLRQRDSLSPYLFVLYMERLANVIKDAVYAGKWIPYLFGKKGPKIYDLFFADDLLLFGESSIQLMEIMRDCINRFCLASRAKVNVLKTKCFCSQNTPASLGNELSNMSGFEQVESLDRYLGVLLFHGRVRISDYSYLIDCARKKLAS